MDLLFWVVGFGALLGCHLGGGFGVWVRVLLLFRGLGRGSGVWVARAVHGRAGGGGALQPLVGSATALGTGPQCCP